jgi:hypothetical protein
MQKFEIDGYNDNNILYIWKNKAVEIKKNKKGRYEITTSTFKEIKDARHFNSSKKEKETFKSPFEALFIADCLMRDLSKEDNHQNKIEQEVKKIINKLETKFKDGVPLDKIIKETEASNINKDKLNIIIKRLKYAGEIYEPKRNCIRLI